MAVHLSTGMKILETKGKKRTGAIKLCFCNCQEKVGKKRKKEKREGGEREKWGRFSPTIFTKKRGEEKKKRKEGFMPNSSLFLLFRALKEERGIEKRRGEERRNKNGLQPTCAAACYGRRRTEKEKECREKTNFTFEINPCAPSVCV